MRTAALLLCLSVCVAACVAARRPVADLAAAAAADPHAALARLDEAFLRHDVGATRAGLEDLRARPLPSDLRVDVELRLATLAWRFFGDPAAAHAHLDAAERTGVRATDSFAERARMESASGDFEAARSHASRALAAARQPGEQTRAALAFGHAVLDEQLAALRERRATRVRAALTRQALALVRAQVVAAPGALEPARLELGLALLAGDGAAALEGWRSYYHVSPAAPAEGLLSAPAAELADLLPGWNGPDAPTAERVARALAASRCFPEAALAARTPPRELAAYAGFVLRLARVTDAYYRELALGRGDHAAYLAEAHREAEAIWPELAWTGAPPPFSDAAFAQEIDRRFGALVNFGRTAGYEDLHMGHRVVDDRRVVSQYGRTAQVRFIALDAMVSNGFESWAWDGRAQHGGWADETTIVEIRSGTSHASQQAWRELADPKEVERVRAQLARDQAGDDERARQDPHAYLPGLATRLRQEGLTRLRDRLARQGVAGDALRLAFLPGYERAIVESSIFAHEGRHAIDRGLGEKLTPADLEFRAKLSQVVFAPELRLDLDNIFSPGIGDETPHGQADLRIMKGLVAWMEAHAGEIHGLERARPLLPQFDRLTDEQIRAAFASMDPFAPVGAAAADDGGRGHLHSR